MFGYSKSINVIESAAVVGLAYIFNARCYAERGIAAKSRLSVRLSVTLRYRRVIR